MENEEENGAEEGEVEGESEGEEEQFDAPVIFSAVQVVNRFHEVFATHTLFPSERVASIAELFLEEAVIASLKKPSNVYLKGRAAIGDSFLKTAAAPVTISKRVFLDLDVLGAAQLGSPSSAGISFCFDLHRAGMAPGLGDKAKDTLLLYRCVNAQLTSVWGMVDADKLASNSDLSAAQVLTSAAWSNYVWPIVARDVVAEDGEQGEALFDDLSDQQKARLAVFHNYDHMETWG